MFHFKGGKARVYATPLSFGRPVRILLESGYQFVRKVPGNLTMQAPSFQALQSTVESKVVGRRGEIEQILAALNAGRHLILEGAPGTAKSTLLRAIAGASGLPVYFVEGGIDLTLSKLVGHFPPADVFRRGFSPESFEKGPLVRAMEGGLLYIEEFNRMPADTANVFVSVLSEGRLVVPRYGLVEAHPAFRVLCAQNPLDDVGTQRVSRAIYDRFCRVELSYQSKHEEEEIVLSLAPEPIQNMVPLAVDLARATREHPDVRQGSSLRGAIDMLEIAHVRLEQVGGDVGEVLLDAALSAMSGRIWLRETSEKTPEEIIERLFFALYYQVERGDDDGARRRPEFQPEEEEKEKRLKRLPSQDLPFDVDLEFFQDDEVARLSRNLLRDAKENPADVGRYLSAHRNLGRDVVESPLILDLYSYIKDDLDEELRDLALKYAGRLIMKMARQVANLGLKAGPLQAVNDINASDEVEIDGTLARIIDNPTGELEENILVLARKPEETACMVFLDHSSSMRGIKVSMAALAAATIALHFREHFGVVVFNTKAHLLKPLRAHMSPLKVAEEVLSLSAVGYTNIRDALLIGVQEMQGYSKKLGILLSDGDWTHGGSPLEICRLYSRLHVIGLEDPARYIMDYEFRVPAMYREWTQVDKLAREGKGTYSFAKSLEELPGALAKCLQEHN